MVVEFTSSSTPDTAGPGSGGWEVFTRTEAVAVVISYDQMRGEHA